MNTATISEKKNIQQIYPLLTPKERVSVWKKAKGIWKNKKPDPILELKKIRKEWDRKIISTK